MPSINAGQRMAPLLRPFRRVSRLFLLTVIAPTALAAIYFGLIASDVFVSESHFIVRSEQHQTPTGLGALLQGTGFARSQDDTYSVVDFVESRDALKELDTRLKLRTVFSDHGADVFNRFPGLDGDDSVEALFRIYQKRVEIVYDSTSSISILRVRAFKAESAARINEMLLEMSERLVNQLNARSHHDLIEVAEREVKAAEDRSQAAALALSAFRADRQIFDPDRQGAVEIAGTAKLREQLVAAETQLAQVRQVSPNNPQVASLQKSVDLLQQAIRSDSGRLVGRQGGLTAQSPAYERLVLDKTFADRQLASLLVVLDTARSDAARKQLYLERLVQPNVPDYPAEPRRLRSIMTVFVLGLVAWGILALVVASIKEHGD